MSNIPIPLKDIACQDLIAKQNIVHHGNLRRRRMLNNWAEKVNVKQYKLSQVIRWRQSYVVLFSSCIYIYDNEMSTKPTKAASLYGFVGVEPCEQEMSANVSWPFKLTSAFEDKDRTYYFSAPSKRDLEVWIKCIQEQLLAIFRMTQKSVPTAFVSPLHAGLTPDGVACPPFLPPRDKAAVVAVTPYAISSDEDDIEFGSEYTEILDEDMDDMKNSVVEVNSGIQNRLVISPNSKDGNITKVAGSPVEPFSRRPLPFPGDSASDTLVKLPPKTKPKPNSAVSLLKNTFINLGDVNPTDGVDYVGSPQYLELESDCNMSKNLGVAPEAVWNGKPNEADEVMKNITYSGAYMLRESSAKGAQTLLVKVNENVVKYKIQVDEKGRQGLMVAGPYFDSLALLINFYKLNPLPKYNISLTKPYSVI